VSLHLGADWAAWWHPGLTARYEAYQQDHALQQITKALVLVLGLVMVAIIVQLALSR
jgi:hypothetical protein